MSEYNYTLKELQHYGIRNWPGKASRRKFTVIVQDFKDIAEHVPGRPHHKLATKQSRYSF